MWSHFYNYGEVHDFSTLLITCYCFCENLLRFFPIYWDLSYFYENKWSICTIMYYCRNFIYSWQSFSPFCFFIYFLVVFFLSMWGLYISTSQFSEAFFFFFVVFFTVFKLRKFLCKTLSKYVIITSWFCCGFHINFQLLWNLYYCSALYPLKKPSFAELFSE